MACSALRAFGTDQEIKLNGLCIVCVYCIRKLAYELAVRGDRFSHFLHSMPLEHNLEHLQLTYDFNTLRIITEAHKTDAAVGGSYLLTKSLT